MISLSLSIDHHCLIYHQIWIDDSSSWLTVTKEDSEDHFFPLNIIWVIADRHNKKNEAKHRNTLRYVCVSVRRFIISFFKWISNSGSPCGLFEFPFHVASRTWLNNFNWFYRLDVVLFHSFYNTPYQGNSYSNKCVIME